MITNYGARGADAARPAAAAAAAAARAAAGHAVVYQFEAAVDS